MVNIYNFIDNIDNNKENVRLEDSRSNSRTLLTHKGDKQDMEDMTPTVEIYDQSKFICLFSSIN